MKHSSTEKAQAFKQKMARFRKEGGKVVVHQEDGTDNIRYLRPRGDGQLEWTDPEGNVIPDPEDPADPRNPRPAEPHETEETEEDAA